jgi:hypothetical protein
MLINYSGRWEVRIVLDLFGPCESAWVCENGLSQNGIANHNYLISEKYHLSYIPKWHISQALSNRSSWSHQCNLSIQSIEFTCLLFLCHKLSPPGMIVAEP